MLSSELQWRQHCAGLRDGREINIERWCRYFSGQSLNTVECNQILDEYNSRCDQVDGVGAQPEQHMKRT